MGRARAQGVIHGRADVFDWTGVLGEYSRWARLKEDPNLLLDKYGVRYCLLRKSAPISLLMTHLPGWRRVYSDDLSVVFARGGADLMQNTAYWPPKGNAASLTSTRASLR